MATTLNDFLVVDNVTDVLAVQVNQLRATSLRSEYGNLEALSAKKTLTDNDTPIQALTLAAAQTVVLPAESSTTNHPFAIYNDSTSTHDITVKEDSETTTIKIIAPGEWGFFVSFQDVWLCISSDDAIDGWTRVSDAWTYASATTITVPSGAASLYSVGDRIRFTQTTVKYGAIVAVADTLLTILENDDFVLVNAAISDISYSHELSPVGYPGVFDYTPEVLNAVFGDGTVTGQISMLGRHVKESIKFVMGGTSSVSAGVGWTPKADAHANNIDEIIGTMRFINGTTYYDGVLWAQTTTRFRWVALGASGTYATHLVATDAIPFSFTDGDIITSIFEYEVA